MLRRKWETFAYDNTDTKSCPGNRAVSLTIILTEVGEGGADAGEEMPKKMELINLFVSNFGYDKTETINYCTSFRKYL